MNTESFVAFEAQARAAGFDEVMERQWGPGAVLETHTHPFDAQAVVVQGELWLTSAGSTQHIAVGGTFALAHGTPHSERYGPQGATYWVARRNTGIAHPS